MKKLLLRQLLIMMSKFTLYGIFIVSILGSFVLANDSHGQTKDLEEVIISARFENAMLEDVFQNLEALTEFHFAYDKAIIDDAYTINVKVENKSLALFLNYLSYEAQLKFKQIEDNIYISRKPSMSINMIPEKILKKAQAPMKSLNQVNLVEPPRLSGVSLIDGLADIVVTGQVTNAEGSAMEGVTILLKGTERGTLTDGEGKFSISVPDENAVLLVSFVGYERQEVTVGSQKVLNIVMQESVTYLDEVVVTGYGTRQRKDLTGSIVAIGQEDYENQPVNRVDQILQGRTAGVNVTNSSGAPGGSVSIRIRGANSINGSNEPLYVIDGFVGADFRDINPNDIESLQILKDASATAIYGSRGANGVVLITTKSGQSGKPKLSLTTRFMVSEVLDTWDIMDAATFAETANARAADLGTNAPFTQAEIQGFRQNGGTDWQDELLRTAFGQEYQLDYSGGNDAVTYFVSGNYLDQEGIVINSDFRRYSLRTNVKGYLSKWLTARLKMNFVRRENNNTNGNGTTSGILAGALAWSPTTPAFDESGVLTLRDPISSIKGNPIELAQNDAILESNTFNANGGFAINILEGLTLDLSFGASYINSQNKNFSASSLSDNPNALRRSTEQLFLQSTNNLTYNKLFAGKHNLSITAVMEHQMLRSDMFQTIATGLQFPDLRFDNITLANSLNAEAFREEQTITSYIGRINYTFDDKYLITAAVRSDGSSKFRGDNRFGTFPSLALGWRISEEGFMQGAGFLDDLKIRGSFGVTGSQALPVFGTLTTFRTRDVDAGTSFQNGQLTSGIIIGNPGNPNLRWETTEQLNVGFDLLVLDGRLGITADYFQKNTTDLLLSEPLPQYAGGGSIFRNLGEVRNDGIEFSITATPIQTQDFVWNTSFNASFLQNEVVNIGDREQIFPSSDAGAGLTNLPEMIIIPGQTLATFYGLKYLGVWQQDEAAQAAEFGLQPGDSRYEDLNGDGVIGGDDYQIIGSAIPEQLFGWNNTFTYKDFTLNVFFQAMMGFDRWNFTYAQAVMPVADAREATHVDVLDRWSPTNTGSNIPAFSQTNVDEIQSSRFVEAGDFIRLKNLSLSYALPQDLIKGINGSVMIGANNLLTITDYRGIDPEAFSNRSSSEANGADAGAYPNAKMWTFGINLTF